MSETRLSRSQIKALRSVLAYLRYQLHYDLDDMAKSCGLASEEVSDVVFHRSAKAAGTIHGWLHGHLQTSSDVGRIDDWALPQFMAAFPDHPSFSGKQPIGSAARPLFDAFLAHAETDERQLDQFFNLYRGVYVTYRYGANIDVPRVPLEELQKNAYVVRAAMRIYKDDPDQPIPQFRIHYQHSVRGSLDEQTEIDGSLIPIHDQVYFLGKEKSTEYPLVMTARRDRSAVSTIRSVIIRRHRNGQILASRLVSRKLPNGADESTFEEERFKARVYRESDLEHEIGNEDEIGNIRSLMRNHIDLGGKATLKLDD